MTLILQTDNTIISRENLKKEKRMVKESYMSLVKLHLFSQEKIQMKGRFHMKLLTELLNL